MKGCIVLAITFLAILVVSSCSSTRFSTLMPCDYVGEDFGGWTYHSDLDCGYRGDARESGVSERVRQEWEIRLPEEDIDGDGIVEPHIILRVSPEDLDE